MSRLTWNAFTDRTANALRNAGITDAQAVLDMDRADILRLPSCGSIVANEIDRIRAARPGPVELIATTGTRKVLGLASFENSIIVACEDGVWRLDPDGVFRPVLFEPTPT